MAITVRKGNEADFDAIMDMIKELAAFEKATGAVRNSAAQMAEEKGLFGCFVAEHDGRPIGYAIYFFAYYTWVGKSLYMEDIYVRPEFRGRKVGSMLLRKVFEVARENGCKRVRWQVLDWNADAIGFYKKRGARVSKEWLNCDFDEKGIESFLKEARTREVG